MPHPRPVAELIAAGLLALGIAGGTILADEDLAYVLHAGLDGTNTETSFDRAKEFIYNDIDREDEEITCVYSGTVVTMPFEDDRFWPNSDHGFEVEHTWASKASWMDDQDHFPRSSVPGADLHHLFPARQGLNGSRSNHPFGEPATSIRDLLIDEDDGTLHQPGEGAGGSASGCSRGLDAGGNVVFMPREEHRGNVARAMFYMSVRYWWEIPDDMEATLREWHEDDPVDDAEEVRNDRVEVIQRNRNPFIDEPDLVEQIEDF